MLDWMLRETKQPKTASSWRQRISRKENSFVFPGQNTPPGQVPTGKSQAMEVGNGRAEEEEMPPRHE